MANVKSIELKGIVHNATKIGMQDGASEDLINMRFKDGTWRPVGTPTAIGLDLGGVNYDYIYVHENTYTNVIAHSYNDGALYWIATNNVNGSISELKMLPSRVTLLDGISNDVIITQNGNLICVIDSENTIDYLLFMMDSSKYVMLKTDVNGKQTDRDVFPFGNAHINLYSPNDKIREDDQNYVVEDIDKSHVVWTHDDIGYSGGNTIDAETASNLVKVAFGKATERNLFTRPFIACLAVKMYDGSYLYATSPKLICPRQALSIGNMYSTGLSSQPIPNDCIVSYGMPFTRIAGETETDPHLALYALSYNKKTHSVNPLTIDYHYGEDVVMPTLCTSISNPFPMFPDKSEPYAFNTYVFGSDMVISINTDILKQNKDLFTHVAIFVTPEVDFLDFSKDGCIANSVDKTQSWFTAVPIFFKNREIEDIKGELMNSSLHLLKEYKIEELESGDTSFIVDLTKFEDENILKNIALQKSLPIEAMSRTSYLPRYAYSYNGRLHLANYDSIQFHGYPIDSFHKDNHSVKIAEGVQYPDLGLIDVLTQKQDSYLQGNRKKHLFFEQYQDELEKSDYLSLAKSKGTCFAYIRTTIETAVGEQVVTRYIPPFDEAEYPFAETWIEDLNSLISFPDIRAKKMEIQIFSYSPDNRQGVYYVKVFDLKPHRYLNLAYYLSPNLEINDISKWETGVVTKEDFNTAYVSDIKPPKEKNIKENFRNGLKVSKTDNPMYFPVENTYQIGNDEIIAMCANTIAVGFGQTGDAPLYVFSKDGVYALFVDASGQMTYTNARPLSREVCISGRSVTPVDFGVVFVSHRGLMIISGSDVSNLGEKIEGDIFKYACSNPYSDDSCTCNEDDSEEYHSNDYNKIMSNALRMKRISGFDYIDVQTENTESMWDRCDIGYDHINSELIVSFGNLTFVYDKYGNWSRRNFKINTFVNKYPYTLLSDNKDLFYFGKEDGANSIYALTNVIKLESIGFKSISRLVARGYFETHPSTKNLYSVFGGEWSYETWKTIYDPSNGINYLPDTPIEGDVLYISPNESNYPNGNICIEYKSGTRRYQNFYYDKPIDLFLRYGEIVKITMKLYISADEEDSYEHRFKIERPVNDTVVGLYVFGSYDGRKWSCLGHKEKSGKFNDIGCIVSSTDCKFFRFLLAGRVTSNTRFDYFEVTDKQSLLSTKSR